MREKLFRGKRLDNGAWVESDSIMQFKNDYSNGWESTIKLWEKDGWTYIDKNTFGEFTGLPDKNGKKIFEGDIVRLSPPKESNEVYVPTPRNPSEDRILQVVFFDGMFAVDMRKWVKHGYGSIELRSYETERIEVIGNIYDNPELLEVTYD